MSTNKKDFSHAMIRVNQAGEQGALDIYKGQLRIFKGTSYEAIIESMYIQEQQHKKLFDQLMQQRHVRPTFLSPIWRLAGEGLGIFTALLGKKAAMVCTDAVEEVICKHYQQQLVALDNQDYELHAIVTQCEKDEREHQEKAIFHGSRDYPGYFLLSKVIKMATHMAVFLSKKI